MLLTDALFNSLLMASSGYAMYTLPPLVMPFGYAVAAAGLVHGLLGAVRAFKDDNDKCKQLHLITSSIMEVIPLPFANIELYLRSSQPQLAMAHSCVFIPLAFDMLNKVHGTEDSSMESLKDLMLVGNVVSMAFLGSQSNDASGLMAAVAFFGHYVPAMLNHILDDLGSPFNLAAHSLYIVMMAATLSAKLQ